jgi:site-specific DNA-methyltransferase (adenine-specific)
MARGGRGRNRTQAELFAAKPLPSRHHAPGDVFRRGRVSVHHARAEALYAKWPEPVCIIVDGPYGVKGFPGDPPTHQDLPGWYAPHVDAWTRRATPQTTLWFWGTEIGWATVHPLFVDRGWEYRNCHVWNKGPGHIAGNANSLTLRKFPVVTEVCVQYVKPARFEVDGRQISMKEWLRHEWQRSGLPMYLANKACGVENAATRKYLTACHLWYFPPVEAFVRLAAYVNEHGKPEGRPYFSVDGVRPIPGAEWEKLRAKFDCEVGVTNVWTQPALRGQERMKEKYRSLHNNQKPLNFIEIIIRASTETGDVVWEPFGGLCPGAVVSHRLDRRYFGAEVEPAYYLAATERLATYDATTGHPDRAHSTGAA